MHFLPFQFPFVSLWSGRPEVVLGTCSRDGRVIEPKSSSNAHENDCNHGVLLCQAKKSLKYLHMSFFGSNYAALKSIG